MELKDILRKELMILDLEDYTKEEVIEVLIDQLVTHSLLDTSDKASFVQTVLDREEISSTGVGDGIAIPHGMSEAIKEPVVVYAHHKQGLDFESMDNQPAHHFFLIAIPKGEGNEHLTILANLSTMLMKQDVINHLNHATTQDDVIAEIGRASCRERV